MNLLDTNWLDRMLYVWSWLFSPIPGAITFGIAIAVLLVNKAFRAAFIVACSAILTASVVTVLKALIAKPRPSMNEHLWATDGSFPSGHAAISACVCALIVVLTQKWPKRRRIAAIAIGIAVMMLTGLSRVHFQVHFVSDVLAGYVVGFVLTLATSYKIKNTLH